MRRSCGSDAGGRGRRLHLAPVPAGALRQDRGARRARDGGGASSAACTRPTCARKATTIDAALDEAIRIGREARIPVEIWHLKVAGKRNWGRMPRGRRQDRLGAAAGVDIAADTYAYPAWFNSMSAFVPPWAHDGGDVKLIERLQGSRDAAAHPPRDAGPRTRRGTTSGRRFPGPASVLIGVVQNPALKPTGEDAGAGGGARHTDAIDALFDLLVEDEAYTSVRGVRDVGAGRRARARSSRGCRSTTTRRAPRPTACSARSTRTRAPTGRFRASCGSTCARSGG